MSQFNTLSHSTLIDLLARHTVQYTQMLTGNIRTDEFYNCKRLIEQLATEIESRKKTSPANNSVTIPLLNKG